MLFTPRPPSERPRAPTLVDLVLDPAQRAAVERPEGGALLILGEAGHGKTTVAIHRLAHLWKSAPGPLRAGVVVPTDGLARLLQPLLRRLGVDVEVTTYDRWASVQARRAFRRLPRESESTPPSVMRMKRSPALRLALEELAGREPGRIDDDVDVPARRARSNGNVSRGDLQHLFGDRVLLERVACAGHLPDQTVADTLDRTRVQFAPTAEEEWSDVTDRGRLVAVDRRALDEGTSTGWAKTVDVEDYAVLFELDAMRASRTGRRHALEGPKGKYDVLLVDEAQELAPLELALLGRTLAPGGTLIVAGDAQQQTDETTAFVGWPDAMRELGAPRHEVVELEIGYRCPPGVVALARAIAQRPGAGPLASPPSPRAFTSEAARDEWLARGLEELQEQDPRASVGIVCRSPHTARRVVAALHSREVPARVVFDGRFLPRGIQASTVDEVKGLEFDFVVVPDAGARDYPDDAASRRSLYVAVTRTRHELALACVSEASPLLL
jgi:DNA helicase II / ATP-dependent DNA helicase PcrA